MGDLAKGGPAPVGVRQANLSATNLPYAQEIALNEQASSILPGLNLLMRLSFHHF